MKNLLLVDDNPFYKENDFPFSKLDIINQYNHLEDGDEVLDFLKNNNVDVIIMDWKMKRMNGFETIKEIRKHSEFDHITIIGWDNTILDEEMKKEFIEAGANVAVKKSFRVQNFINIVNNPPPFTIK